MDFRHVVDLVYRKIAVQYYQVHSYSLLHRYHFSQKVTRKRRDLERAKRILKYLEHDKTILVKDEFIFV